MFRSIPIIPEIMADQLKNEFKVFTFSFDDCTSVVKKAIKALIAHPTAATFLATCEEIVFGQPKEGRFVEVPNTREAVSCDQNDRIDCVSPNVLMEKHNTPCLQRCLL